MALFGVHGLVRPKKCLTPPTLLEMHGLVRPKKCLTPPTLLETRFCVNNRSVPGRRKAQGQNRNAASQDSLSGCSCRGGFWSRRSLVRGSGLARTFAGFARQHLGDLASEVRRCEGLLDERHAWNQHVSPEKLAAVAGHVEYLRSRAEQADFLCKSRAVHSGHNDIGEEEIDRSLSLLNDAYSFLAFARRQDGTPK